MCIRDRLSIRQLSELVSFVTQDNFLFNCSLKDNIRLGNPNATDEEAVSYTHLDVYKRQDLDDFDLEDEEEYLTEDEKTEEKNE